MRICAYSSLIFAVNTTVLLIVSLTTDYWEYRTIDRKKLFGTIRQTNTTRFVMPYDTTSYFQIIHSPLSGRPAARGHQPGPEEAFYHAPLFVRQRLAGLAETNSSKKRVNDTERVDDGHLRHSEIVLFEQYGNLFRDCDDLEVAVRTRIGLKMRRPSKCVYFHVAWETSSVYIHAQALAHIESWAAGSALLCMLSICLGSMSGARALFSRRECLQSYSIASTLSLIAGFFLTLGIALFHGKCQLLRKMELLPDRELPYRDILNSSRVYSYGWSFILAWICVIFCYISSYVWLTKAQGPNGLVMLRNVNDHETQHSGDPRGQCQDVATV